MKFYPNLVLVLLFMNSAILYSQDIPEKHFETFDSFLTEQKSKIEAIEVGETLEDLKDIIGHSIRVKVPRVGRMKPLNKIFKQPEYSDHFNKNSDKPTAILWYFSDPKDQNGIISKRECTPIILVNNQVVGKGWEFFNSFRKKYALRK